MRPVIFLSGPYTNPDPASNVERAIAEALWLIEQGAAPLVPHLSHYVQERSPIPYETWIEIDLSLLPRCDAVYRMPGTSPGADRECALAFQLGIPVLHTREQVAEFIKQRRQGGDIRFRAALEELWALHCRKSADYGKADDPLSNLRASEAFGIPAWKGVLLREHDKTARLQAYCQNGRLANEGVEDTLLDKAAYSLDALILFRESRRAN